MCPIVHTDFTPQEIWIIQISRSKMQCDSFNQCTEMDIEE